MARTRTTYTGDPGEVWTNTTGKVQYQFIANWVNTCGLCCQYDHQIGASWPIPLHRSCRCKQILVAPGQSAQPFTDFHETISTLDPVQQSRVVGRSNLTLIEKGVVKWEDVVTRTRVRDFREVVARGGLSVQEMTKAGVNPRLAADAFTTVHTPAHELAAAQRQTLLDQLLAKGLTKDQVRQALAERLAARVGIGQGPSGPGPSPIVPGTPSPKPPPVVPPVLPVRVKRKPKPTPIPIPIPMISGGSPEAIEKAYLASLGVKASAIAKVQPETFEQQMAERVDAELARLKAEHAAAEKQVAERLAVLEAQLATGDKAGTGDLRAKAFDARTKARELKELQQRHEDWQRDVKVNPNLIPPFAAEERLKIYAERGGDEKLKAIQGLEKKQAANPDLEAAIKKSAELQATYASLSPKKDYRARESLANEIYNLNTRRRSLERKAEDASKFQNGEVATLIAPSSPIGIKQLAPDTSRIGVADLDPKLQPSIDTGLDFLRAVVAKVHSKDLEIAFGSVARPDLARSNCSDSGIVLSPNEGPGVVVHEVGHWLDHKTGSGAAAKDFLSYRVGDEKLKAMKEVAGEGSKYGDHEMGRKDKFDEAFSEHQAYYIGKDYSGDSTEITAMGIEKLYNDPVNFAKKDPEYCMFILGVLSGELR